jgi:hypothetical protein
VKAFFEREIRRINFSVDKRQSEAVQAANLSGRDLGVSNLYEITLSKVKFLYAMFIEESQG